MSNKHNANQNKTTKSKSTNKTKPQDNDYAKLLKRLAYLEAENDHLKKARCLNSPKTTNSEQITLVQELRHKHALNTYLTSQNYQEVCFTTTFTKVQSLTKTDS
ncbi:MAG: hypothetical protein Q3971_02895 [Moraxella sp.]|nr:hypothetical protein [Moraxella sp.]